MITVLAERLAVVERLLGRAVAAEQITCYAGQQNELLIADGLVLRFPRVEAARREAQREAAILAALAPKLPLPIPQPCHVALEQPCPLAVMTYPLLSGERLSAAAFGQLAPQAQRTIVAQLMAFLQALRAIDPSALPIEQTVRETPPALQDMLLRFRTALFPRIGAAVQARVDAHFVALLQAEAYRPALRHGDLGASNILFDPIQGRLTGVLDWGGRAVGDPALDLASLTCPASLGRPFLDLLGGPVHWGAEWERAQRYMGLFALEEALWGAENDDPAALARGLQGLDDCQIQQPFAL